MRFVLAGLAFLCSLVCFGVGAWQIVEATSSNHVTIEGSSDSDAPLIVLPSETLVDHAGAQQITVTGDGPIVAVVGRQSDVAGWIADTAHDRAVVDEETGALVFEAGDGAEAEAPNPLGSDLWYQEYEGEGTLEIDASLPPGFAVLVASTGTDPAPSAVSITWPLDGRAPWSGPLLVAGIVFLLVALGLLLWALLSMRRGVRPRRHSTGPVDLRPSTSPLAVGAASEEEAEAVADAVEHEWTEGEHDGADDAVDVSSSAFGAADARSADADATGPASRDGGWGADASTNTVPAVDADARAGSDETAAIALASEPQPVGDPFANPEGASAGRDGTDDAWAPPESAWAAPQEPVSIPAPEAPPLATRPGLPAEQTPAEQPAAERVSVESATHGSDADETNETPSPTPDDAGAPPRFGIRAPEPAVSATAAEQTDDTDPDNAPNDGDDEPPTTPPRPPAPPTPPAPPVIDGDETKWKRPRGRDRGAAPKRTFRVAAILLVGSLGLTGCSSTMWPEVLGGADENPTATPTSTVDEALLNEGAPMPAVNEEQLGNVLEDVRAVVAEADAAGDADALAARFTGAALEARGAAYRASAADGALPGPLPFPNGEVVYAVPQATDTWPRTVFTVIEMGDVADEGAAPAAIMLQQENARSQYKVASFTQLAANVQLPEAAPASIGAPGLDELAANLVTAPDELAAAYGELMLGGDGAASADTFATEGDTFLPQVGQEYRDQQLAAIDTDASRLEFSNSPSENAPLGVGTLDGGAIVAVSVLEVEKFSARTQLATLSVSGRAAALAGVADSPYGFERIYTDQVLFYVPPAEAGGQVQFLGYSQMMTSARQLDQSEVTYDS